MHHQIKICWVCPFSSSVVFLWTTSGPMPGMRNAWAAMAGFSVVPISRFSSCSANNFPISPMSKVTFQWKLLVLSAENKLGTLPKGHAFGILFLVVFCYWRWPSSREKCRKTSNQLEMGVIHAFSSVLPPSIRHSLFKAHSMLRISLWLEASIALVQKLP